MTESTGSACSDSVWPAHRNAVWIPGVYEDTRLDDLKHEFKEAQLD